MHVQAGSEIAGWADQRRARVAVPEGAARAAEGGSGTGGGHTVRIPAGDASCAVSEVRRGGAEGQREEGRL